MLNPLFLEAQNGALIVILTVWFLLFARYILQEKKPHVTWAQVRRSRAAAIAFGTFLLGDNLIRISVWSWQHYQLAADHPMANLGISLGVLTCIWGGICGIRHFAPDDWGRAPWILTPVIGLVFGIGMVYFRAHLP